MPGLIIDRKARTISGLVVPYGQIGKSQARRYRFAPGSLLFPLQLRLLRDHNRAERLGTVVQLSETTAGPWAVFRVVLGPAGDRALLAGRAGFSPGVDRMMTVPDPEHHGVLLVKSAACLEVSLTDDPAFDWR